MTINVLFLIPHSSVLRDSGQVSLKAKLNFIPKAGEEINLNYNDYSDQLTISQVVHHIKAFDLDTDTSIVEQEAYHSIDVHFED